MFGFSILMSICFIGRYLLLLLSLKFFWLLGNYIHVIMFYGFNLHAKCMHTKIININSVFEQ